MVCIALAVIEMIGFFLTSGRNLLNRVCRSLRFTDTDNCLINLQCLRKFLAVPTYTGYFAWFIIGAFFRYREVGKICSGDYYREAIELDPTVGVVGDAPYSWKSGKFLSIYYIVVLCALLICCFFGCCAVVIAWSKKD